jgi:hypothetical protein
VFFTSLSLGVLSLVVVSLLTPPERKAQVDSFFGRMQTTTDAVEGQAEVSSFDPQPSKAAALSGKQMLLVNLLQLKRGAHGVGLFRAYREDVLGFFIGVVICALLVVATGLLLLL